MTRKTVGNGEPTSSHPFVLGSRKTQKNTGHFRSGMWENTEEHGSFSFWDVGKHGRTRVIFVLGCGKTRKITGHFCSGMWELKHGRTRVIFVLGSGKTRKNTGHFRSGMWENTEEQGSFSFWAVPKRREVEWTEIISVLGFRETQTSFRPGIWENSEHR